MVGLTGFIIQGDVFQLLWGDDSRVIEATERGGRGRLGQTLLFESPLESKRLLHMLSHLAYNVDSTLISEV